VALLLGSAASRTWPAAVRAYAASCASAAASSAAIVSARGDERPPGLGQGDAATVADDQPDAGFGLQPVDVVADRRLAVAEFPGRGGQRAVLRDRAQHEKPPDIEHGFHRHTIRAGRSPQDGVFKR